jgi:hypothetical protein
MPDGRTRATNDFHWAEQGAEYELKRTRANYLAIHGRIVRAASKAAKTEVVKDRFVIDIGDETLTDQLRDELAGFNRDRRKYRLADLWVMYRGRLERISLRDEE